jgi:DNA polymerase-3 subunit beta
VECIEIEGDGADFCIDSAIIMEILKQIPEQPITIEVTDERMRVEYFPGPFDIPVYGAELFPVITVNEENKRVRISGEMLAEGLSLAMRCIGKDEMKPVLSAVFMELNAGRLTLAGTDANVLAFREFSVDAKEQISAIIPGRAAKLMASLLPVCEEEVEVVISPRTVSIESNGYKFVYLLSEGRYPNFRGIIPQNGIIAEVSLPELTGALRRCMVFTDSSLDMVVLSLDDKKITVEGENPDYHRSVKEYIDADYEGDRFSIGVNAGKMATMLSGIDSKRCVLRFSEPSRPVVITPSPEDMGITTLIMPIYTPSVNS